MSADDVDAKWNYANSRGEVAVDGIAPTPDQDVVSELDAAVGLEYRDDEELNHE